jgi:acetyl/propionyl-CoA carboxylase alpha subunit
MYAGPPVHTPGELQGLRDVNRRAAATIRALEAELEDCKRQSAINAKAATDNEKMASGYCARIQGLRAEARAERDAATARAEKLRKIANGLRELCNRRTARAENAEAEAQELAIARYKEAVRAEKAERDLAALQAETSDLREIERCKRSIVAWAEAHPVPAPCTGTTASVQCSDGEVVPDGKPEHICEKPHPNWPEPAPERKAYISLGPDGMKVEAACDCGHLHEDCAGCLFEEPGPHHRDGGGAGRTAA